jgi:hypothetical protein
LGINNLFHQKCQLQTKCLQSLHYPKSGNEFIKTVTLLKAQEEILKAVDPRLLSRRSV